MRLLDIAALLVRVQGSCGYGDLEKKAYPYWSVAALSTKNRFYTAGPANGCGECFEIQCQNSGGQFAVQFHACSCNVINALLPGNVWVAPCKTC